MIDTIRIIISLKCNMHCSHCCNKKERFNSQFQEKKFSDIDFSMYKNVCVTGGEPFFYRNRMFSVLDKIPQDKSIYIYTNGTLINDLDISLLLHYTNLKCVNIGVHTLKQLERVNKNLERKLPVRFMARDIYCNKLLMMYPERLSKDNLKSWAIDQCDMSNEDWVLLTNFK